MWFFDLCSVIIFCLVFINLVELCDFVIFYYGFMIVGVSDYCKCIFDVFVGMYVDNWNWGFIFFWFYYVGLVLLFEVKC